jgi:hypothetical protein
MERNKMKAAALATTFPTLTRKKEEMARTKMAASVAPTMTGISKGCPVSGRGSGGKHDPSYPAREPCLGKFTKFLVGKFPPPVTL